MVLLYVPVYLLWFFGLERAVPEHYLIVTSPLDAYIPFCEYFIIPYLLWFPYIVCTLLYFFMKEREEGFYRLSYSLITGMTIILVIYTFLPNMQLLRVEEYPRENLCTMIVRMLQQFDTPTNVCPSLHVFVTVALNIAVLKSKELRKYPCLQGGTLLLSVLICLSTVFLKQHSVTDVWCAFILNAIIYFIFYHKKA